MTRVYVRRGFVLAVATLLVVFVVTPLATAGGWRLGAQVRAARADAAEQRAEDHLHRSELPAGRVLATLPVPAGLTPCRGVAPDDLAFAETHGLRCLDGTGTAVATAVALRDAVTRGGATGVRASCRLVQIGTRADITCHITASLSGMPLWARIGSFSPSGAPTTPTDVGVLIGVGPVLTTIDQGAPPVDSRPGADLPLPS